MLLEKIQQEIKDVKIAIEPCRQSSEYTMSMQAKGLKKYVFSKYNPRKDALATVDEKQINKETIWIVLGFGLGYLTESIIEQTHKEANIIVVEPCQENIDKQMSLISSNIITQNKNLTLFTGVDFFEFKKLLDRQIKMKDAYNVKIVGNSTYLEFYLNYYKEAMRVLTEHLQLLVINYNTISKFAPTYIENILKNSKYIKNSYDIEAYRSKYLNIPAIIVSAGPSLAKNIELLKDFKGVIFTGGRTLTNVLEQGVRPHFLVSMDPGEAAYRVLKKNAINDIDLIAPASTQHKVVVNNTGKQFFLEETFFEYAKQLLGLPLPKLSMGGSVATLCLSSAYHMGCNPIIFIGQDLATTGFKRHVDTDYTVDSEKDEIIYVNGYYDEPVPSNTEYIIFARWLEKFIATFKDREYINATEGGADIKGTVKYSFEEINKKYNKQYSIKPIYSKLLKPVDIDIDKNIEIVLQHLKDCMQVAAKGVQLSEMLEKEYTQYYGVRKEKITKLLNQLDNEVDSTLKDTMSIVEGIFLGHYMEDEMNIVFKEPLKEKDKEKNIRITHKSIKLYQNVKNSLNDTIKVIEKTSKIGEKNE